MIYIKKGQHNIFGLRLSENSTLSAPKYLFEFEPDFGEEPDKIYFAAPDISLSKNRMNVFELVEGETGSEEEANGHEEIGVGQAHLNLKRGQYTYRVFEGVEITTIPGETNNVVIESGRLTVQTVRDQEDSEEINENPYD